jgi:hypothetical protein
MVIFAAKSSGRSLSCRRLLIGIKILAAPFSMAVSTTAIASACRRLCRRQATPLGFQWVCEPTELGAKKRDWKRFLTESRVNRIEKLGFKLESKSGAFFLQFIVEQEALAVAIEGNNLEDAFEPMRTALSVVVKSWKTFDDLIGEARDEFGETSKKTSKKTSERFARRSS